MQCVLENRVVISCTGSDISEFLQGMMTNDLERLESDFMYTLFLNNRGRLLADAFIIKVSGGFLMDVGRRASAELFNSFYFYKLSSDVEFEILESGAVIASDRQLNDLSSLDPRCDALGYRTILSDSSVGGLQSSELKEDTYCDSYLRLCVSNCIIDVESDCTYSSCIPFQYDLHKHSSVNLEKGCYLGQEVVAKMMHRGSIKKGIYRIRSSAHLAPKTEILAVNDKCVGSVCSSHYKDIYLAVVKHEYCKQQLHIGESMIEVVLS